MAEHFRAWADAKLVEMVPGLDRRTLAYSDDLMLVEFRSRVAGVEVPLHSHPHHQTGYVVSGELHITIDGTLHICKPGDSYIVPGGVQHGAVFPVETVLIDCFTPARQEYK